MYVVATEVPDVSVRPVVAAKAVVILPDVKGMGLVVTA